MEHRGRLIRFVALAGALLAVPAVARADLRFVGSTCSSIMGQQDTVTRAFAQGQWFGSRASDFMDRLVNGAPDAANGTDGGADWGDRRQYYERWFGPLDATRVATVRAKLAAINDALDGEPIYVNCYVDPIECAPRPSPNGGEVKPIAWVDRNAMLKTINLCDPFWLLRETGTDSLGGVFVHEVSHFTSVAATSDVCDDTRGCEDLARTNVTAAIQSASNYQYFAEDMPVFLPSLSCCSRNRAGSSGAAGFTSAMVALGLALVLRARRR